MSLISCEMIEKSQVVLTIEVGAPEFEAAIEKAYQKMRKKINVPGFRPGKAPRKIIEGMYGAEVFIEEAINIAFPEAYEAAVKEQELQVVGYPSVEIEGQVTRDGFTFKATAPVYPEVTLGQYKGLSAPKEEVKVSAADVDERLKALTDRNTRLVSVDREAKEGDTVVIDFEGFEDGKPKKSDYKRFQVRGLTDQDDYASMRQVLCRRFRHYLDGDSGFAERPDALLIDGGAVHAETVRAALSEMGVFLPIFGMVKDNRHRTRALVTPDGQEISIQSSPAVFALIGRIQEETHRFAITYQRTLRSRHVRGSQLDAIPGIGEKRRNQLLRRFRSLAAIRAASREELQEVLPAPQAQAVYDHYRGQEQAQP